MNRAMFWHAAIILGCAALLRKIFSSIVVFWHRRQKAAGFRGEEPKGEMVLLNSLPLITVIIVGICVLVIVWAVKGAE